MRKLVIGCLMVAISLSAAEPGQPRIVQITPCATGMAVVWYAERGRTVDIEASTNMVVWHSIRTNVATGALCACIDSNINQCRFYRLKVR